MNDETLKKKLIELLNDRKDGEFCKTIEQNFYFLITAPDLFKICKTILKLHHTTPLSETEASDS